MWQIIKRRMNCRCSKNKFPKVSWTFVPTVCLQSLVSGHITLAINLHTRPTIFFDIKLFAFVLRVKRHQFVEMRIWKGRSWWRLPSNYDGWLQQLYSFLNKKGCLKVFYEQEMLLRLWIKNGKVSTTSSFNESSEDSTFKFTQYVNEALDAIMKAMEQCYSILRLGGNIFELGERVVFW